MINLLNKLLSKFKLQVVPKQEEQKEEYSLVNETLKFLDTIPKSYLGEIDASSFVGEITYLKDKNGKTYFKDTRSKTYYCDYDMKNPSKEILGHMISETTFTPEELKKKLNND
jgi:hypothetical protein